jgi:acetyl esterase
MSLDPEILPLLALFEEIGMPDPATMNAREMRDALPALPVENPTPVRSVEDREIPGPGGPIPVRIFTPEGGQPTGVLLFFHGGGWVIGDLDSHDETGRQFCAGSGAVVVSVDYRLAPEAPFPAGLEDCYAATAWAADHAEALGAAGGKIAVSGDSAGGNLAAAVSLLARERGGPAISHQLLIYPVTDSDFDRASYLANADGYFLTRDMMRWFWAQYLPEGADRRAPLAAPLHADLRDLPPATVITAGFDPLRDEGIAFAEALDTAGVPVEQREFEGMIHGFISLPMGLTQGAVAMEYLCNRLRDSFSG